MHKSSSNGTQASSGIKFSLRPTAETLADLSRLLGPCPDAIPLLSRLLEGPFAKSLAVGTNPHGNLLARTSWWESHPSLKGLATAPGNRLDHQNQGIPN